MTKTELQKVNRDLTQNNLDLVGRVRESQEHVAMLIQEGKELEGKHRKTLSALRLIMDKKDKDLSELERRHNLQRGQVQGLREALGIISGKDARW